MTSPEMRQDELCSFIWWMNWFLARRERRVSEMIMEPRLSDAAVAAEAAEMKGWPGREEKMGRLGLAVEKREMDPPSSGVHVRWKLEPMGKEWDVEREG